MFLGRFSIHCVRACRIKETGGIVGRRGVQLFGTRSVKTFQAAGNFYIRLS